MFGFDARFDGCFEKFNKNKLFETKLYGTAIEINNLY